MGKSRGNHASNMYQSVLDPRGRLASWSPVFHVRWRCPRLRDHLGGGHVTPAQHERAKELFAAVVSLSPEARADYLVRNSVDDFEVRAEVERLLRVSESDSRGLGEVGRLLAAGLAEGG